MITETLQSQVIDPIQKYLATRTEREKVLLGVMGLAIGAVLLYQFGYLLRSVTDTFTAQSKELHQAKETLAEMLDEQSSPLKKYARLSQQVIELEQHFKERLKSEGNIASLEQTLMKHIGPKYFSINEKPVQSFEGGLAATPFIVSFKTGSLDTVAKVLRDLTEGPSTFSISSVLIEKTYKKYLNVKLSASSMKKEGA
jgi:hypothetical protein